MNERTDVSACTRRKWYGAIAHLLAVTLLAMLCASSAFAQTAEKIAALDAYFNKALNEWKVPGFAVAIVEDGEVALAKGYGMKSSANGEQVDENTLFAIASNTKAFTAAALAILVDEGKLSWDDRAQKHLPYFRLADPYVSQEMRVRDLLSHRSGLGTFSGDLLWYGTNYSAEEVTKRVRFLPLVGQLRASYGYSNIMFLAAGEIIPAVTGTSFKDFVRSRILDVLGMQRTVMSVKDLREMSNVAMPHKEIEGQWQPIDWYVWDNATAAGGIISSVSDMAKWMQLQLGLGEIGDKRIFSEEASRTMWTPHNAFTVSKSSEETFPSTHFRGYGLGWVLMDYLGRKVTMHGGGYDGMFSRLALVPEENFGMVILTNGMTGIQTALMYKTLDTFFDGGDKDWSQYYLERALEEKKRTAEQREKDRKARVANTAPSQPLANYSGTYGGDLYGDVNVKVEGDHLVVQFGPAKDLVGDLRHWHYDTFAITWRKEFAWFGDGKVQFLMDQHGKIVEMKIDVPNEDFWFTELEFKRKK